MAGTVEDVIRIAEGELGNTDGSKYFEEMGDAWWGQAWCARFGRWVYWKAGVDCHWPYDYTFDWRDAPSQYVDEKWNGRTGDAVTFDWADEMGQRDGKGDHFGIVLSKQDWGLATIEGNTGTGVVAYRQRVWDDIICVIHPTFEAKDEWIKADDGRWWYRHADGSYTTDGWEHIDGEWYYFDAEGWMVTGWVEWGGWWYYLSEWTDGPAAPEGHMVKGGIFADKTGNCYAFYGDGRMVQAGDVTATPSQTHDGTFGRLVTA